MSGGAEERHDREATFATVDRQVDRGLLTCCVEVPPPKYNILTAENARLEAFIRTQVGFHIQLIVTSIQHSPVSVVGLEWDMGRQMVRHHPLGVVKVRLDLR